MRCQFDEGVPQVLARALISAGLNVERFPKAWKGLQNGRLLTRLEGEGIECLITWDKNLAFQQTIGGRNLSVLVLPATKLTLLEPLASPIVAAVERLEPGAVGRLDLDGRLTIAGP